LKVYIGKFCDTTYGVTDKEIHPGETFKVLCADRFASLSEGIKAANARQQALMIVALTDENNRAGNILVIPFVNNTKWRHITNRNLSFAPDSVEGASMRTQILRFAYAVIVVTSSSVPACFAQAVAAPDRPAPVVQRTPMRPGVRYTTGSYVVSGPGWEKQLTSNNPNLGHWNWIPVIGYTQSTGTTAKQAVHAAMPEQRSVYVKPNHVPLPVVTHSTGKLASKADPIQPPVIHLIKQVPSEGASSNRAETHTQAVLSYAGDYHGSDSFHAASNVRGMLAHKSVGAVMSQSIRY